MMIIHGRLLVLWARVGVRGHGDLIIDQSALDRLSFTFDRRIRPTNKH